MNTIAAPRARQEPWGKREDMIVRTRLPYNAEPPPSVLASDPITPLDAFYSRTTVPSRRSRRGSGS